jgi:hypothetical protein
MDNQDRCPSFDKLWEDLEHEEGGEVFVRARKIAEELTKSIEMEHDKGRKADE